MQYNALSLSQSTRRRNRSVDLMSKLELLTGAISPEEMEEQLAGITPDEIKEKKSKHKSSFHKPLTRDYEDTSSDDDFEFSDNPLSIDNYLQSSGYKKKKDKKKKKTVSENELNEFMEELTPRDSQSRSLLGIKPSGNKKVDKMVERTRKFVSESDLFNADEFDSFLDDDESIFSAEEDAEMRNHLISMGRKYARDSAESKESSEINKTFADSDKRLKNLFDEVSRDKESIQRDIDRLRVPGRGGKTLSDMLTAKKGMHDTQLQIIKEINSMKKNIYDLRAKEAARKEAENAGGNDISANTLQSIFSSAKNGLIGNMGGYSGVSGAIREDDESSGGSFNNGYDVADDEMDDEEIQRRYFRRDDSYGESDGDKFLKYEDRGVEYVLEVDSDNKVLGVHAEDRDGILIPDYPLPSNINELTFDIDPVAKRATDTMHRNYKLQIDD